MTLKAIADELNVTTMTVYRRLSRAGIDIKALRAEGTNEITVEGAGIIASLFKNTTTTEDNEAAQQVIMDVLNSNRTSVTSTTDGATAAQVASLTAKAEGLERLVTQLEGERDRLQQQVIALTAALEREQADRQHERQLLTAGTVPGTEPATTSRRWKWPWQR